ncbi:hypothetical protein [Pseudodesulfovibrio indicus]|uniref:hypothetical protein n=1 Tax=Pseudodesulfovibrio indicus TaxID=1716143 RepID=UPI00292FA6BF|nr:hypothetical protein [Pseudodesulfovibrio indicus]
MRLNTNLMSASTQTTMPFAGLGFAMAEVREAARSMTPVPHCHGGSPDVVAAAFGPAVQVGGYKLLVTLGREIRGR